MEENIKIQEAREKLTEKVQAVYKKYGHILLEAATASGKTLQAIKLIKEKEAKWLIIVPKVVLIDNWKEEFIKHGYEHLLDRVDIITYASAEKYADAGVRRNIIADEAHNINERKYLAIRTMLNLNPLQIKGKGRGHFIALSGSIDNERRYMLHKLGVSPASTVDFTTDDAVESGLVADYQILVVELVLDNTINQPLRFNKWKTIYNKTEADVYDMLTVKYQGLLQQGLDTKFATLDRMKFLYDLPTKAKAARLILAQLNPERKVLTFGSSIAQVDALCEYTHHSKKSKKDTSLQDFKDGKINRLGAITTIAEGVNIPDIDTGFIVQAMSKDRHMIQRLGRFIRHDDAKFKPTLIVLSIKSTQDERWVNNSLSYFDKDKVHYTTINKVALLGIEEIIANL